jgi:cytochrome c biogenesis protein CcmG, thiol:disulfide interchange protein DsbE
MAASEPTSKRRPSAGRGWRVMWVVCIVVAVAALATLLATGGGSKAEANQTRPVRVTGTPLPTFSGSGADSAVGMTIPTVSGQSFDGTPVEVKPDGRAHVVLFMAHWCPHCNREIDPLSNELRSRPLPSSVEMTAVSTAVTPSAAHYPPEKWLKDYHWPTPVMADSGDRTAAKAFGLGAYPYFVFVDAQGRIVSRYAGEMPVTQFRTTVARLAG